MITGEVDLSDFENHIGAILTGLTPALKELSGNLAEDAESYAFELINRQIYNTPLRSYFPPGKDQKETYYRTGALGRSIEGRGVAVKGIMQVTLEASASYASENEIGRGESRISVSRLLASARQVGDPLGMEEWPRKRPNEQEHLEPRPFIIPAVAQLENELPDEVFRMVDRLNRTR